MEYLGFIIYFVKKALRLYLKRVQRKMSELSLYSITVKKYRPHSNKKVA